MPAYLITYDKVKDRNYDRLLEQLRKWNCVSPAESVWLGVLLGPAPEIRDLLIRYCMDADDRLTVVELKVGSEWATQNAKDGAAHWLSTFVTAADNPEIGRPPRVGLAGIHPRHLLR